MPPDLPPQSCGQIIMAPLPSGSSNVPGHGLGNASSDLNPFGNPTGPTRNGVRSNEFVSEGLGGGGEGSEREIVGGGPTPHSWHTADLGSDAGGLCGRKTPKALRITFSFPPSPGMGVDL